MGELSTDKTPARIAGMFDAIAPRYDLLNHVLSAGLDRRWRARAVAELRLGARARVLDLCTGTADLALTTVRKSAGATVIGVDFAGQMLRLAQAKLRTLDATRSIHLVRGDATKIPLADASCDAATIGFGIRNVVDPAGALAEIARVLRPGARLAILEFGLPVIPAVRPLYLWYFNQVLPRIGRAVSRHDAAYSYLPASVGTFQFGEDFARILRDAGFSHVKASPLAFGIVYLYTAQKL